MRRTKAAAGFAAIAVGGALILGGCGGGDDASATTNQARAEGSMKQEDAMKDDGDSYEERQKRRWCDEGRRATHDEGDDHGQAMKDG